MRYLLTNANKQLISIVTEITPQKGIKRINIFVNISMFLLLLFNLIFFILIHATFLNILLYRNRHSHCFYRFVLNHKVRFLLFCALPQIIVKLR